MDNVLIDRSASGFEFQRWSSAGDDDFQSFAMTMSALPPPDSRRSIYGSFPHLSPPLPPFHYDAPYLHSSFSLPPLHHPRRRRHPPLLPLPAPMAAAAKGTKPAAAPRRTTTGRPSSSAGECKRKKPPRTPRPRTPPGEEAPTTPTPRAAQRRKPLERATALPAAATVHEALDDLERLVTRGFVEDLMHALAAPPPSSLPLPTFSLVRAATATRQAAVPSPCTV